MQLTLADAASTLGEEFMIKVATQLTNDVSGVEKGTPTLQLGDNNRVNVGYLSIILQK